MKHKKNEEISGRGTEVLNYVISFTMMGILIMGSFFLPQLYNYRIDNKSLNTVHYQTRDQISFTGNIEIPAGDRTAILVNMIEENGMNQSMSIDAGKEELLKGGILEKTWEQIEDAISKGMFPESLANYPFDESKGYIMANYLNVGSSTSDLGELTLWNIYYSDDDFYFFYIIDAQNYKIYFAELSYDSIQSDWQQNVFSEETVSYAERCLAYYELEHYYSILGDHIFEMNDCGMFGWISSGWSKTVYEGSEVRVGFDPFFKLYMGASLMILYGIEEQLEEEGEWGQQENIENIENIENVNGAVLQPR